MNSSLGSIAVLLAAAVTAGCTTGLAKDTVVVRRATIVGVYPPVPLDPMDYGDATEVGHLENAVLEARRCVPGEEADVHLVFATVVVLLDGRTERVFEFPGAYPDSVAGILAKPGAEPQVVRTSYGPNELQSTLPAAAISYFPGGACLLDED